MEIFQNNLEACNGKLSRVPKGRKESRTFQQMWKPIGVSKMLQGKQQQRINNESQKWLSFWNEFGVWKLFQSIQKLTKVYRILLKITKNWYNDVSVNVKTDL